MPPLLHGPPASITPSSALCYRYATQASPHTPLLPPLLLSPDDIGAAHAVPAQRLHISGPPECAVFFGSGAQIAHQAYHLLDKLTALGLTHLATAFGASNRDALVSFLRSFCRPAARQPVFIWAFNLSWEKGGITRHYLRQSLPLTTFSVETLRSDPLQFRWHPSPTKRPLLRVTRTALKHSRSSYLLAHGDPCDPVLSRIGLPLSLREHAYRVRLSISSDTMGLVEFQPHDVYGPDVLDVQLFKAIRYSLDEADTPLADQVSLGFDRLSQGLLYARFSSSNSQPRDSDPLALGRVDLFRKESPEWVDEFLKESGLLLPNLPSASRLVYDALSMGEERENVGRDSAVEGHEGSSLNALTVPLAQEDTPVSDASLPDLSSLSSAEILTPAKLEAEELTREYKARLIERLQPLISSLEGLRFETHEESLAFTRGLSEILSTDAALALRCPAPGCHHTASLRYTARFGRFFMRHDDRKGQHGHFIAVPRLRLAIRDQRHASRKSIF